MSQKHLDTHDSYSALMEKILRTSRDWFDIIITPKLIIYVIDRLGGLKMPNHLGEAEWYIE
ncbi:MAG TPA: hypothetical protein VLD65_11380 [Anaerolineales bacterium]|nr:hypothetical protein [Anaerolineales bacterium]